MNQKTIDSLNPGIRKTVAFLNENRFMTCDSGDGKTHDYDCDLSVAYVHMMCDKDNLIGEADRLFRLLACNGVDFSGPSFSNEGDIVGPQIDASYSPNSGSPSISLFGVDDAMLFEETKQ